MEPAIEEWLCRLAAHPELCLPHATQRSTVEGGKAEGDGEAQRELAGQLRADFDGFLRRHSALFAPEDLGAVEAAAGRAVTVAGAGSSASRAIEEQLDCLRMRFRPPRERMDSVVRNRRYLFLRRQLALTEYFTPDAMRQRAPEVYAQYVASPPGAATASDDPGTLDKAYVDEEMNQMRKMRQECLAEAPASNAPLVGGAGRVGGAGGTQALAGAVPKEADADRGGDVESSAYQLRELEEEMKRRWLSGEDAAWFDYDTVDLNGSYDDWQQQQRDREDEYFEEDEDGSSDADGEVGNASRKRTRDQSRTSAREALRARALAALSAT